MTAAILCPSLYPTMYAGISTPIFHVGRKEAFMIKYACISSTLSRSSSATNRAVAPGKEYRFTHGHQRKAITTFVAVIIDKQTGCQAELARTRGNQEAAVKRLSRLLHLLHNERLKPNDFAEWPLPSSAQSRGPPRAVMYDLLREFSALASTLFLRITVVLQ